MTQNATPSEIIAAIESVVGNAARPVSLHEPLFAGNEKAYVSSCIEEGWVSSVGKFVDRFEQELAATCGTKHAVVVVNGTCALHTALVATGVAPGDEVLVPSLTFVATANSVSHAGAIPHFVEVESDSLGIDPEKLRSYLSRIATHKNEKTVNNETGRTISALVPVHVFGHPCQTEELRAIAKEYNLRFIEDATEALGSTQNGKPVGHKGVAVLSFNGNKIITTGGGGAILTDDEALAKKIKHLTTTAKQPHAWAFEHDAVAWNYRLPNLNAALGCAQLEQLPKFVAAKRALAHRYEEAFANLKHVRILKEPAHTKSNYWLIAAMLDHDDAHWRDATLAKLHEAKLLARPIWTPLHMLPIYAHCPRDRLALTESLHRRIINLPSSAILGMKYV